MARSTLTDVERDAYRDAKRAEQRELVEASVRALLTSEGWRRYAETRATFHRYSFGNCMLIASQRPSATHVAGFRAWQSLGRQVRKGERSIKIMAPMAVADREARAAGDTDAVRMLFRAVPVFDVSQTDGEPLAEPPCEPITGDSHAHLLPTLKWFAESLGFAVSVETLPDGVGGYCDARNKRIVLADDAASENAKVRTMTHEIAHALGVGYADYGREVAEVIVETVTIVVLGALGLDTSGESIPYIAGWGEQDLDALRAHAAKVDEIARQIEQACGLGKSPAAISD